MCSVMKKEKMYMEKRHYKIIISFSKKKEDYYIIEYTMVIAKLDVNKSKTYSVIFVNIQ